MNLTEYIRGYANYTFEICPSGHNNTSDNPHVYMALLMGTIPIVKTSPMNALYLSLPVVIVKDWDEITPKAMRKWKRKFGKRRKG